MLGFTSFNAPQSTPPPLLPYPGKSKPPGSVSDPTHSNATQPSQRPAAWPGAQVKLFGGYTRWACDLSAPHDGTPARMVLTTADAAVRWATNEGLEGPVHLNCPFREPLLPRAAPWSPTALQVSTARPEHSLLEGDARHSQAPTMTMTMKLHLSQPARLIRSLNPTQAQQDFWPTNSNGTLIQCHMCTQVRGGSLCGCPVTA